MAGNRAARPGGLRPCLGAVLPPGPQALRFPRADPGVLGTARPARPLPTRREPPVTCRRCWATAPLAPQPLQPRLPLRLPPRPPLPGDGANTALLAPSLGAQRSCCPAARARGTPGSGCSGPATPTLPRRKSREEMLLGQARP